jgi:hypothetical protein
MHKIKLENDKVSYSVGKENYEVPFVGDDLKARDFVEDVKRYITVHTRN